MANPTEPKSGAQAERDRIATAERERLDRMRSWSQARDEGIREGLLMAMKAISDEASHWENGKMPPFVDAVRTAIIDRGNRHFGDAKWRAEKR